MVWLIGFGVTVPEILRVEISQKMLSQQKITKFSQAGILLMIAQNPIIRSVL